MYVKNLRVPTPHSCHLPGLGFSSKLLEIFEYLATFLSQRLYPQGSVPLPSTPMKPSLHRSGAPRVLRAWGVWGRVAVGAPPLTHTSEAARSSAQAARILLSVGLGFMAAATLAGSGCQ
jgi:hypothetical protein